MRILHLNAGNETGGGMHHILGLMNELNKEEFILGVMEDGELLKRANNAGIRTIYFPCHSRFSIPLMQRIKSYVQQEDIGCIHTHGPRANVYANILKKIIPFQWVVTIHSNPFLDFMEKGMYGKVLCKLNLHAVRNADKIIAISQPFKDCLMDANIDSEKIVTTLNGIDFKKRVESCYCKQDFGIPEGDIVFLMVARLEEVKGHRIALEAFCELLKSSQNCHLMLAGDGSLQHELERMVANLDLEKHVHFLGYRNDIEYFYQLADVTLLTSLSESFPLVLLESAKVKTPVISTDVGGVGELVVDKSLGWRIKPGNTRELLAAMKDALFFYNQGMLPLMGSKLYHHASTKFTLEILAENIYNVYQSMQDIK
ncbi:MAG: glycosyltransferase family 4 protein [Bacillota bacterium]|uniref:glycosyltransferase family 4 protein n=1 Tax=unclassified Virgibacillus TaxID=2620237 RepID=UPI000EF50864|nr:MULTISPECIES: glycosyltransferase family 4 protein [unclassified Virgibacillus]MCC2248676.1 glycosyltransferase family 4 protein [Virgibacillus sp. AGTR]QRZ18432.1 glycosyltransferase family 4 protein [Virgibacillus sp. AGTR]